MIQNISQLSATLDGYQSSKPASLSRDGIGTTGTGHNAKVHGSLVTHDFHVVEKVPLSFSTFISWLMQAISRATGHIPNMETLLTRMSQVVLRSEDTGGVLEESQLNKLAGIVENLRDRFLLQRGHIVTLGEKLPEGVEVRDAQAVQVDSLAEDMVNRLERLAQGKRGSAVQLGAVSEGVSDIQAPKASKAVKKRKKRVSSHASSSGSTVRKSLPGMPSSILELLQAIPEEKRKIRAARIKGAEGLRQKPTCVAPPVRRKTQQVEPLTVFPENMHFASGAAVATDISWKG